MSGHVVRQLLRDLLHLGIAQIAILFLHYLLFGNGELTDGMVDFGSGAEAGGKQNNGPTSCSVYSLSGSLDVLLLKRELTGPSWSLSGIREVYL